MSVECRECSMPRSAVGHGMTEAECSKLLGHPCLNPSDHHRFRPNYRRWLSGLWQDIRAVTGL